MTDSYLYLGPAIRGYLAYADAATGKMLVAEPGGEYKIRPVDEDLPVPPSDGMWEQAPVPAPKKVIKVSSASPAGGE